MPIPNPDAFRAAYESLEGQVVCENASRFFIARPISGAVRPSQPARNANPAERIGACGRFRSHAGISVAVAAVALGACVIEKHLTLDRKLPGPDHLASIEPGEFQAMVDAIRETEFALGGEVKMATKGELKIAISPAGAWSP